ncbi:MAG: type 4a pilus biogenesis protein PilO [Nitrospinota bacterium]|nr:type 4a pilus biogenesis protein PilO [Nitrospinota bacterium]
MDKLFDKLPYDKLEGIKLQHFLAGAVGVGILLMAIAYFTLLGAVQKDLAQLQEKKAQTEQTLTKNRNFVGQKDMIFRDFIRSSGKLSSMKRQLPTKNKMVGLLNKLTMVSQRLGVKFLSFKFKEGSIKDYYMEIPISIKLRGGFWNTMDVLESLQSMLQLIDFTDLDLSIEENVEIYEVGGSRSPIERRDTMVTKFTAKAYVYVKGAENKLSDRHQGGIRRRESFKGPGLEGDRQQRHPVPVQ